MHKAPHGPCLLNFTNFLLLSYSRAYNAKRVKKGQRLHTMKKDQIKIYYTDKQSLVQDHEGNLSKSPLKPKLLMEFLAKENLSGYFCLVDDFKPFDREDFYLAHTERYVNGFFDGIEKIRDSDGFLGIQWSEQFADSVRYTNASLYYAILNSVHNPQEISFSPTSGFHHASPEMGGLFCTFSGQVIASVKIYRSLGLSGAYIDLDGHYGNSIEDSRAFVKDLDRAIPREYGNINIASAHEQYIKTFKFYLEVLEDAFIKGKIHYLVFCHGADSHEEDDLGRQCTTEEWLACSELFYNFVKITEQKMGKPIPLALSLFGGYREDDYDSVLSLHTADLVTCLNTLCGHSLTYQAQVKVNERKRSLSPRHP